MPRRLAYRPTTLPIWIAFGLALLLLAIALALAWWRIGNYDGAVARGESVPTVVAVTHAR
ncbi:hypothetical protein [Nocardioides pocheonensis]|uniref:Uncharacterized protein n=1 Tax=Nocardioides pocheonensis TaxID=661485 RepID=A0A3N0GWC9_9ACTN|nr:hypothetical protein [Nocardioides pocheonensis]RNM16765.1 hypothetical protein EFL26_04455 [Nocardioides pocheonensis]